MSATLLDLMDGRARRDAGLDHVTGRDLDWADRADRAIAFLAGIDEPFSSDDVRELVGDPPHPNAMGARFMGLSPLPVRRARPDSVEARVRMPNRWGPKKAEAAPA